MEVMALVGAGCGLFGTAVKMVGDYRVGRAERKKGLAERFKAATDKHEADKAELERLQNKMQAMQEQHTQMAHAQKQATTQRELRQRMLSDKLDSLTSKLSSQMSLKDELNAALKEIQARIQTTQEAVKRGIDAKFAPTPSDIAAAKRLLGYRDNFYHIAIAGCTGTGKSSLINAMRGLKNTDRGAAGVGYVETTMKIQSYEPADPQDKVRWYDVPGAGTLNIPRWDYFKNQCLYMFDAIILAWDNRLMDTDVAILTHCRNLQIPCFVLRSKCDVALENFRRDIKEELEDKNLYKGDSRYQDEFTLRYKEDIAKLRRDSKRAFDQLCEEQQLAHHELYLVSSRCIYKLVKPGSTKSKDAAILDEEKFLKAFEGAAKRGVIL
eukprot:Gregarina_sp_Pseudo_9__763@NODE_148_length_3952_cov_138_989011_g136_i0_p2_GENE_NODE_148_length_3952_cov_138_989011_g136_i0NODE_148_length_3952_cov_138_989011_g136_i0_p2_ORF_typecomplete_len381_score67_73IIGP/PF05049_13/1_8e03IIGP/PF05049_13/4_2e52MMR_HSR1/PF01926_23/2_5e03MMR_HSR1/PF01926_23/3_9e08FeoB_N/PF02421_18/6_8e08AAA_15/PF13175_6/1_5AAA_15/PF13175_6/0_0059AIG1/PF04548_16/7_8e05RsgA_GTPase/PF03193_16/0_0012RsgA_GTPase/PF03193_16/9_8e02Dynamin_N/PF00350_23/9_1e02Dynamin_N/PF00350_23/0_0012